ncbi:MAG: hypothetical protein MI700_02390 [Balneolales bacterium]|nr:hypothetical protein [Balneolales bacterium]
MLHAQTSDFDPDFYYQNSVSIQKTGMYILGGWAFLNILSGYYGNQNYSGETKYFFQMNAAWNLVNLGIAGAGLYGASTAAIDISTSEMFSAMNKFDRILLINAALDVLYIGAGSFMLHRGLDKNSSRLIGYGRSVILQGGFLLIFDLGLYLIHSPNTKALFQITENLDFSLSGFTYRF